jgi:hypothetical protein
MWPLSIRVEKSCATAALISNRLLPQLVELAASCARLAKAQRQSK